MLTDFDWHITVCNWYATWWRSACLNISACKEIYSEIQQKSEKIRNIINNTKQRRAARSKSRGKVLRPWRLSGGKPRGTILPLNNHFTILPNYPSNYLTCYKSILEKSPKVRSLDSVFSWQADKEVWKEEDTRLVDDPTDMITKNKKVFGHKFKIKPIKYTLTITTITTTGW